MAKNRDEVRVVELYAGLGGFNLAVKNQNNANIAVVASLEINTNAVNVYAENFGPKSILNRNILSLTADELKKWETNAIFMSPPCQPFTRLGKKLDVEDDRCESFLHVLSLVGNAPDIEYIIVENVSGFESSSMRDKLIHVLVENRFHFLEFLLSPTQFGIPNSRLRYYLLARKGREFDVPKPGDTEILYEFPYCTCPTLMDGLDTCQHCQKKRIRQVNKLIRSSPKLASYLDDDTAIEKFLVPDKILLKYGNLLDLRTEEFTSTCCFTKGYTHLVEGSGSVLVSNPQADISVVYEKYNRIKESNPDAALEALKELKIRYFSPSEVKRLMCFPDDYKWPSSISDKTKYKLLGNSVNVYVVSLLVALLLH